MARVLYCRRLHRGFYLYFSAIFRIVVRLRVVVGILIVFSTKLPEKIDFVRSRRRL
jgi:hypothetical protein